MKCLLLIFPLLVGANLSEEEGSHLPKEVKENLEKQFGTDLETRVANLRKIGYEFSVHEEIRKRGFSKNSEEKEEEGLSIWEINQRAGVARYFWDGDIDLTPEQFETIEKLTKEEYNSTDHRDKRQAMENLFTKWRNRKVYYYFDDWFGGGGRQLVKEVLEFYEKNTCIRFEENSEVANRIKIRGGLGCSSNVGAIGGEQGMSLGRECWTYGNVAHEFLHALGFHHTHARPDRDDYVSLKKDNIEPDIWTYNFPKKEKKEVSTYAPYEYASVMHYPADAFALNSKLAIIAKDHRFAYTMGSRRKLTFYDLKALNDHYMCTAMCPPQVSAKCSNGGYPNPNKCSVCICPEGYGGQFCNERPSGCGSSLVATSKWQVATMFVNQSSTRSPNGNLLQCHDWITAPEGKFVEVTIQSLRGASCRYACNSASLEIKLDTPEATSPRFCCGTYVDSVHVSKLNPTPVIAYTHKSNLEFEYLYRYVDEAPQAKETDPEEPTCTDLRTTCFDEIEACYNGYNPDCPVTCNTCSN